MSAPAVHLTAADRRSPARVLEDAAGGAFNLVASGPAARVAAEVALAAPARVLALVLESPAAPADAALAARLAGLTLPTLVLLGARDDAPAHAAGRAWVDAIPGAHLVYVYDAGATIAADRPEAFAEVTDDFLERHEAFVISRSTTVIHP